jgi:phosphoglycerate dehydrogenase-like enzyme
MLRQGFSYLMAGALGLFLAVNASAAGPAADAAAIISELGLREAATPLSRQPGWSPEKVVITAPGFFTQVVPDYRERLHAVAGDVELVFDTSGEFVPGADLLAGADALIGFCSPAAFERVDAQFLWVHNYFVGMDRCASLTEAQIEGRVFTNGKRLSGPTIAEHVMAMLLSLARGLPAFQRAQGKNHWDRAAVQSVTFGELKGKTLLVAGLGGIGTEVAWRAHALGMRVIATRNSSREGPEYVEYVGLADEMLKLAGRADVVVNALPLTASTTDVFDAGFFAAMPKGGVFISVGRGRSTVTTDLVAALQSGHLYGAGLDVTEPEPLPPESPLWQMDNVIITPHVAAAGAESVRRGASIAIENLRRYVAGEALLNPVNMGAGY